MTIQRSYQFNAATNNRGAGLLLSDYCDLHGRLHTDYTKMPYCLDIDTTDRLQVGDRVGFRGTGISLPVEIVGGFHENHTDVSTSPYNVTAEVNLPSIASYAGKILKIKKVSSSNSMILTPNGTDTIEGTLSSKTITGLNEIYYLYAEASASTWRYLFNNHSMGSIYYNSDLATSTTSGSYVTMATSASTFFSGRPVIFFVNGSMALVNGSDVLAEIGLALRVDSGGDTTIGLWTTNKANAHSGFNVTGILIPSRGSHTIDVRWRRNTATGTATMDTYDFLSLHYIEL
jgi:hypothetical protein